LAAEPGEKGIEDYEYEVKHGPRRLATWVCKFNIWNADEVFSNHSME